MSKFDYSAPAELFGRKTVGKGGVFYRRFDTAAAAIRFAIEGLGEPDQKYTILEVDEVRLEREAIHALYASGDYPLTRTPPRMVH
jgi:hypothetical protein